MRRPASQGLLEYSQMSNVAANLSKKRNTGTSVSVSLCKNAFNGNSRKQNNVLLSLGANNDIIVVVEALVQNNNIDM